jgi:hypothetical protein
LDPPDAPEGLPGRPRISARARRRDGPGWGSRNRIGHSLHAEADVTVDPRLRVVEDHELAHHVEEHLIAFVGRLTAATIHVSPAS